MNIAKTGIMGLWVLMLVLVAGCAKLCTTGYEGKDCNTLSKNKFLGVWTSTSPPATMVYLDTISDASGLNNIVISRSFGVYAFAHSITAAVSNSTITISAQMPDSNNIRLQGTGTLNSAANAISWNYQIINAQDSITSYAEFWTK